MPGPILNDRAARYALYSICFGFFLVLLDTSALNVAMVNMEHQLGETIGGLQWVVNSYTLMFASFLLTGGALGDRFGSKLLYQLGLVLFTLMSLASALAPSAEFLIVARSLQGLGAALMLPGSLSLLSHAFPDTEQRARAVGFWAGVVSLGFAAGPVLGGILTHYCGWRSIFWINVPVGALAFWMNQRFVEDSRVANPRPIDWKAQILILLALFSLNYGLIGAGRTGWMSPVNLIAFGLTIALAVVFLGVERRSASPVLPGSLFSNSTFSVCILIGAVLNFTVYGVLFIESLYLQNVRHFGALHTGLIIIPFTVLPTVTTRLIARFNGRDFIRMRLVVGQMLAVAGAVSLGFALRETGIEWILIGLGLMGVAMGCIMPAMTAGVLSSAPAAMSGVASGILNSSRQVGGTLGVALMGTLMASAQREGMTWSFVLTGLMFLIMAGVTGRYIPGPRHSWVRLNGDSIVCR
jgi:DHA2 family methylenomycin A resistance protein-like MFS transporter